MFIKKFVHLDFPSERYKKAERVETPTMRLYRSPMGMLYPSVTTVLGHKPKPELDIWRAAVGEEEAARISEHASRRGTKLHDMAESYLNNGFVREKANPMILQDFLPIKKVLDEHVDNVFHTELQMYSDRLRSAGTMDLIAEYDGKLSMLDFKTSRRIKYETDIEDYFMQTAAYCCMVAEHFDFWLEDIIILMMVDGDSVPKVFKKKSIDYVERYVKVRKEFENAFSI